MEEKGLIAAEAPETIKGIRELQIGGDIDVSKYIQTIGQVNLTDEQKVILYAPVKNEEVEIRSDGLVYLPWVHYVKQLHNTFGMEWALIPKGMPMIQNNFLYWGFFLVIKGSMMGFAIGQQEYYETNDRMTWGDACEGAKSNALMRLCKQVGISHELWDPSFNREWVAEYADSEWYFNKKKNKNEKRWWKKGAKPEWWGKEECGDGHNKSKQDTDEMYKMKQVWLDKIRDVMMHEDFPEHVREEATEKMKGVVYTVPQLKTYYDNALKVLDKYQRAKAKKDDASKEEIEVLGDEELEILDKYQQAKAKKDALGDEDLHDQLFNQPLEGEHGIEKS